MLCLPPAGTPAYGLPLHPRLCLQVLLDGFDLRTLRLCWMRSQMALVSQEPALFDAAVCDNIASSRPGEFWPAHHHMAWYACWDNITCMWIA